jgi:hypothetical protein
VVGEPPVLGLLAEVPVDVLGLEERLEPLRAELASPAGHLHPAEGAGVVVGQRVVDPHRADLHALVEALDAQRVRGPKDRPEPHLRGVHPRDRLVEPVVGRHGDGRAERLLTHDDHVVVDVDEHGGFEEPSVALRGAATGHHPCAGGDGLRDVLGDLGAERCGGERSDVGALLEAVAEPQRAHLRGEPLDELVAHRLRDEHALGGGADLTGVDERRVGQRVDGAGDVRIGCDDERVLAAELEVQVLHHRRGDRGDARPGRDRAGHGDHAHLRMGDERLPGLAAVAGDDVDDAGRQVGEAAFDPLEGDERGELGGLDDHGVAGRERRGELPRQQEQRVVPRHDGTDDAIGLLEHEVELGARVGGGDDASDAVASELGVVAQRGERPLGLLLLLGAGLALLARQELDELVALGDAQPHDLVEQVGTLVR